MDGRGPVLAEGEAGADRRTARRTPQRAPRRLGKQTVIFSHPPAIVSAASVVGPMEGKGPLAEHFDVVTENVLMGEKSWERAEVRMMIEASELALKKAGLQHRQVDWILAGDLLNQITCTHMAARTLDIPALGQFSACATLAQGLAVAGMILDGGFGRWCLVGCCSHHDTAERQYRLPTEFASQRPPTAQWTVTGAGAFVVGAEGDGPVITHATLGRVVDMGLKDPYDMGSAMAPAAADTIWQHLADTHRRPEDYDLIVTGDLAHIGSAILVDLLKENGLDVGDRALDCGAMIYKQSGQDVHAGGSGCGCSATVVAGYIMNVLSRGNARRVLLVCTGSLHSVTTYQQGETIPCIAHAVVLEARRPGQEEDR